MLNQRISNMDWFNRTVQDLFVETCRIKHDKNAIVYKGEYISFAQLQHNVNKVSNILLDLGVKSGDRITVFPTTTPEFVYIYFAILQLGAIVNPINLMWGVHELKSVLIRNDPKIIITIDEHKEKDFIELIKEAIPDLDYSNNIQVSSKEIKSLTNLVSLSKKDKNYEGFMDFDYLFDQAKDSDETISKRIEEKKSTDIQFICQTSGTTGLSKSALWNHRPPLATANFFIKSTLFNEEDTFINLGPFFHNSGIMSIILNLAYAGTTLHLLEDFNPKEAIKNIDKYKITSTFGFTAHWKALKKVLDLTDYSFTIQKGALAGDSETFEMIKEMTGGSNKISMIYAQTENGPLVSIGEHDCPLPKLNKFTNGKPLPGVEVIIRDIDTGEIVTGKKSGEICYKSPYLFNGYYKQENETKKSFDEDGYFKSGDFGTFEHGMISYLGRKDGVVKSGGENVSLLRVSSQLIELFPNEVEDVQTIGIFDEYWGTKVVSFIKFKSDINPISFNVLKEKCKGKMADYEIPKEMLFWQDDWPITGEGKIDTKKLKKRAETLLSIK